MIIRTFRTFKSNFHALVYFWGVKTVKPKRDSIVYQKKNVFWSICLLKRKHSASALLSNAGANKAFWSTRSIIYFNRYQPNEGYEIIRCAKDDKIQRTRLI